MTDEQTPIPRGVEHLLDDAPIDARIAYIRLTLTAPYKPNEELRRLVNERSHRELVRMGVIEP